MSSLGKGLLMLLAQKPGKSDTGDDIKNGDKRSEQRAARDSAAADVMHAFKANDVEELSDALMYFVSCCDDMEEEDAEEE